MRSTILLTLLTLANYANAESFVTNKIGQLYLSGGKYEIQYVLNITEYKETTKLLEDCIDNLKTICEKNQNPLCTYFLHETKNIHTQLQSDMHKMNALSRQKRFIIFIPILIGVAMFSFWSGMYMTKVTLDSIKNGMDENLNIIEEAANITFSALTTQEQYIKDADMRFSKLENSINNNSLNIELYAQFFGIVNTVLFAAQKHERIQTKLNHVYSGKIHGRLFEIIDYAEFLEAIENINKKIKPNYMLPKINSMTKNNFVEPFSEFNATHLIVSVDLPVFETTGLDMLEFIPFPMRENNSLYMLDMKTIKYYVNNSKIYLLSDDTQKSLCKSQEKTTILFLFLFFY